jgi:hypothetical protein
MLYAAADNHGSMILAAIAGIVLLVLSFIVYFIPTLLANSRNHPSFGGIFTLNLLLDWTLAGWAVSLAWSLAVSDGGTCWRCNARLNGFPLVCQYCHAELSWVGGGSSVSRPRQEQASKQAGPDKRNGLPTSRGGRWKPADEAPRQTKLR